MTRREELGLRAEMGAWGFSQADVDAEVARAVDARPGIGLAAFRAEALARGFTHVCTLAGPIAVAAWVPYGNGIEATWRGEWIACDQVRDVPRRPGADGMGLGVWRLVQLYPEPEIPAGAPIRCAYCLGEHATRAELEACAKDMYAAIDRGRGWRSRV